MTRRGALLFAAMCLIWGIPYLFIRVAVAEVSPVVLVFLRAALGALFLVPVALGRGGFGPLRRRWLPVLGFAAVEIAIPWLALSFAEQQISSSLAGLLISAVPLVAVVLALLFRSAERTRPAALAGLLVGIAGVALVVGFDLRATGWFPIAEVAVVVVGYALGPALLARYLGGVPGVTVMSASLALTAIVYLPFALLLRPRALPSAAVVGSIAVLAVVCTALAFLIFAELIAEVGPVRSTVITYVNPAVAAILGVLALGETLTIPMLAGFGLILAGSVLATRRPRVRPAPA